MYWEIRNEVRSNIRGGTHRLGQVNTPAFRPVSLLVHRLWHATVCEAWCYTLLAGTTSSEDRGAGHYGSASKRIVRLGAPAEDYGIRVSGADPGRRNSDWLDRFRQSVGDEDTVVCGNQRDAVVGSR